MHQGAPGDDPNSRRAGCARASASWRRACRCRPRPRPLSNGPPLPPPRTRRAGLADTDGNRIADGLDRRLEHSSARRRDVVATFADRASAAVCARRGRRESRLGDVPPDRRVRGLPHRRADPVARAPAGRAPRRAGLRGARARRRRQRRLRRHRPPASPSVRPERASRSASRTAASTSATSSSTRRRPIAWLDLIGSKANPYDDMGHGTVVASIALGDGVGPGPIAARMKGVAPDAALSAVEGPGLDRERRRLRSRCKAIQWCAAQGQAST